jgi:hypothetical protein
MTTEHLALALLAILARGMTRAELLGCLDRALLRRRLRAQVEAALGPLMDGMTGEELVAAVCAGRN